MDGVRPAMTPRAALLLALTAAGLGLLATRGAAADPGARSPAAVPPKPPGIVLSSAHFTLREPDASGPDRAVGLLRLLEEGRALLLAGLGLTTEGTVEVLVLTPPAFRAVTGKPPWVRGAFDGRILLRLGKDEAAAPAAALRPVLLHELTHFLLRGAVPAGLPPWFEEGLAERFEGSTPAAAAAWLGARGAPPFAGLEEIDRSIRAGGWREDAGHQGARLAVQALEDLAGPDAAARLLASVGAGEGFGRALERLVPGGRAALEARLAGHGAEGR